MTKRSARSPRGGTRPRRDARSPAQQLVGRTTGGRTAHGPPAEAERSRLTGERLTEHPPRERLRRLLMPVLYRSGRQGHGADGLPQDAKHHGGSVTRRPIPMQFVARQAERCEIDRLVTSAAAGHGGAVVVAGEAGIGKSALVDEAVGALDGFEVLRAAGTEFEQDLLHGALHQLCAPVLEYRLGLPTVQRRALEAVFGLGEQTSPEPLTVGLAVLGLLREAARERPVCCVVDDAQWIDDASRQALVFVARRVAVERIAVVFAARDVGSVAGLAALPRLPLAGLNDEDARAVLGAAAHAGLDAEVFDRILAEARGNPLALLEFAQDAGPFWVPGPRRGRAGVVDALEEQFVHRVEQLPSVTRPLVVLAAAEPVGDLGLLRSGRFGVAHQEQGGPPSASCWGPGARTWGRSVSGRPGRTGATAAEGAGGVASGSVTGTTRERARSDMSPGGGGGGGRPGWGTSGCRDRRPPRPERRGRTGTLLSSRRCPAPRRAPGPRRRGGAGAGRRE
ncbi:ATP-binding protein [Streptomyces sp. NPDC050704]|uniref:ATP-binding protein n=1 Tax=Streptomyces sp. NPDC050704 TaxID=3157219 RepID=UPI003417A521